MSARVCPLCILRPTSDIIKEVATHRVCLNGYCVAQEGSQGLYASASPITILTVSMLWNDATRREQLYASILADGRKGGHMGCGALYVGPS